MGSCSMFFITASIAFVVIGGIAMWMEQNKLAMMSSDERERYLEEKAKTQATQALELTRGSLNPEIICPHCQQKGTVRTKAVQQKKGISGGKATAALLTGGVSMLATGLSRKESITEANCDKCNSKWRF
jgi:hypothetical protein